MLGIAKHEGWRIRQIEVHDRLGYRQVFDHGVVFGDDDRIVVIGLGVCVILGLWRENVFRRIGRCDDGLAIAMVVAQAFGKMRQRGIEITETNELLLECESCFLEALDLGKQVRHYSGEEGLDELWGEPLKVFSTPIAEYYESRYIKIAQTMAEIDEIADTLAELLRADPCFKGAEKLLSSFAIAAKHEIETMKTDPAIFEVWPEFVASGNKLWRFEAQTNGSAEQVEHINHGNMLIKDGKKLMEWIAFARVPMPKTTENFVAACNDFIRISKSIPGIAA